MSRTHVRTRRCAPPLHSAAVLDVLTVPPRLIVRALDDLHTLAQGVRRLTDRDGDLDALLEAVKALPRTEDELSANIAALRDDLKGLQVWLQPLHKELTDLDETAEALERSMSSLQAILKKLPGV
jgi:hypothetical protein